MKHDFSVTERLLAKVVLDDKTGCWNWQGTITPAGTGYGNLQVAGRAQRAHRIAYEIFVGPIPEGLQLDHLCRNKRCVNPGHLEPVTAAENKRRDHASRGTCRSGKHTLAPENRLNRADGGTECLPCSLEQRQSYIERRRVATLARRAA